jgi:thiosulfate dehydrogenase
MFLVMSLLIIGILAAGCKQDTPTPAAPTTPPTSPPPTEKPPEPTEVVITGSESAGGLLYDKWWKAAGVDEPSGDQPLWATQETNTRDGADTWRCKECHGWDYQGANGAYGSGSHFTGFSGVLGTVGTLSSAELLAALDGSGIADHDFSAMGDEALANLVVFLRDGLVDVAPFIDSETKAAIGGDVTNGGELYAQTCTACHGEDGRLLNFHDDDEPVFVGTVALDNPWEFIHKVRAGQPGTAMPSSIVSGWSLQDVVDVLAFSQTLPTEALQPGSVSRGGLLYDKWWKVVGADEPTEDNPLWARQDTNTREGDDTWRCKECHGWDYQGAAGAYGSGSHFTGFPGVIDAMSNSFDDLIAQLTGGVDPDHDFSAMGDEALSDLVSFLRGGLVDVSPLINSETKAAIGGDVALGEELYATVCTACHGEDGRLLNFHDDDEPVYVGTVALDNPWEFIHKVRAGQPGTGMPSGIDLGWSIEDVLNLLAFAQTLPIDMP